jgi:hypothetical protein
MKSVLEFILAVFAMIIIFFVGKSCSVTPKPETIIQHEWHYRDTIFPKDTIYSDRWYPSKSRVDTFWKEPLSPNVDCNRLLSYTDTFKKKEYDIYSNVTVQGELKGMLLNVKLKVPLMIKDCTVVKIDSLVYRPYKYEIHGGIVVSPRMFAPVAEVSIDKSTYMLGYDPFNKQPIIGFKYRIFGWTPKKRKK